MWEESGKWWWIRRLNELFGENDDAAEGRRDSISVIACDKREAFAQGSVSDEAIHPSAHTALWIASLRSQWR